MTVLSQMFSPEPGKLRLNAHNGEAKGHGRPLVGLETPEIRALAAIGTWTRTNQGIVTEPFTP